MKYYKYMFISGNIYIGKNDMIEFIVVVANKGCVLVNLPRKCYPDMDTRIEEITEDEYNNHKVTCL